MSKAWLQDLEEKVHEAAEHLQQQRQENDSLQERVQELESRAQELESQLADSADGSGWEEERDEIRQRVEKLVQHLDQLLAG